MTAQSPKDYQREAIRNALEIFRFNESQLQAAHDDASRAAASAHNGCVLLEAPTGSGKTFIAGMIAEEFSRKAKSQNNAKIVWFWFTPFAGLVGQTNAAFGEEFQGLRVRSLQNERRVGGISSGDIFVATWGAVAASNKDTRKIRKNGDVSISLDEFIPELRALDFRIGVVVDEAHHGFAKATEAIKFYRDVMRPDFTLLVTATPDDTDVKKFQEVAGIKELHRISVSRKDAVDAGLIKEGIKSVAYIAPEDQKQLVDFGLTALADAWQLHTAIKQQLITEGTNLTPLMLVQVSNSDSAVDEARERLRKIGVPEDAVAWYTAEDPNDDLLVVAKDESKQVLIFKVAVALGFNAPRAFTLVSMRGSKDTDFGVQVVGRILRVHPLLQQRAIDKTLPELLRFGYVFLADADNQQGLTNAGEKINSIKTEMSEICPYTMVVRIAGENQIQVIRNGQPSILPMPYVPPEWTPPDATGGIVNVPPQQMGLLSGLVLPPLLNQGGNQTSSPSDPSPLLPGHKKYVIKDGVPRTYKTEFIPLSTDALVKCISQSIDLSPTVLNAGQRRNVKITRQETDIFEGEQQVGNIQARLSDVEIARRAQGILFDAEHLDPRDLFEALLKRLSKEFEHQGWEADEVGLVRSLNLILATYPHLIRKAGRSCGAKYKELLDTQPLPDEIELPPGAQKSRLNIYGVMPQDLNSHERSFAGLLDADTSETVEWWFRNEPRKPWSIGLVLPTGDRYFPDFVAKIKDRVQGEGILLIEIKGNHILHNEETSDKVMADHKIYRVPLMLVRDANGQFMTVRNNERTDRNELNQVFRIENMQEY